MSDRPSDPELAAGLARFAELSDALADGIEAALPGWVDRALAARADGAAVDPARAAAAGAAAVEAVMPPLRRLLAQDPDDQASNPLAIVRVATALPTAVLAEAGVPPVERDAQAASVFPDDVYDLVPASFGDLDPALAELGLAWGAAKAWIHLRRHA